MTRRVVEKLCTKEVCVAFVAPTMDHGKNHSPSWPTGEKRQSQETVPPLEISAFSLNSVLTLYRQVNINSVHTRWIVKTSVIY